MKSTILTFCILLLTLLFSGLLFAQIECDYIPVGKTLVSNNMAVRINSDGTLFHKDGEGYFLSPNIGENSPTAFRKAGIWIGGYEAGTNNTVLKFAASGANSDDDRNDFVPGPLIGEYGDPLPCNYMNNVWSVTKENIEAHIKDWNEDGVIDAPILSIISWPGNGNKNCCLWQWGVDEFGLPDTQHGWAPFYDRNYDGIYDPFDGDYPALGENNYLPNEIYWTVFNDLKWEGHELSQGQYLKAEVQMTAYTMECESAFWVEDFLFTEYKIINQGFQDIDSMFIGIWVDFDLGCPEDDYIGSIPHRNAIYAYNADPIDGDSVGICVGGEISYGEQPPVASVTFLPNDAFTEFVGASYFSDSDSVVAGQRTPQTANEFYGYLNGIWRDQTPITKGGNGYDPGGTGEVTKFAFSDLPSEPNGWSMLAENLPSLDYDVVGAIRPNHWKYGRDFRRKEALEFSVAYGHHHPRGRDHLSIVDRIENWELIELEHAAAQFNSLYGHPLCFSLQEEETENPKDLPPSISIFPNPVYYDNVMIEYTGKEVYQVAIFDVNKNLSYLDIDIEDTGKINLDFTNYQRGVYFIRLIIDGVLLEERIVVF